MSKLLGFLCLVGLVWFGDALSRQEVYDLIHDVSNEFRQEYIFQLKSKMKEAKMRTSPGSRACVYVNVPGAYKDLNTRMASKAYEMMSEWKAKTPAELETVKEEDIRKMMEENIKPEIGEWVSKRIEMMMKCTSPPKDSSQQEI